MISIFSKIKSILNENSSKFIKSGLSKIIEKWNFFHYTEDFDFSDNPDIFTSIEETETLVINQYCDDNDDEQFFIICFKNTLCIIDQKMISLLESFFSLNDTFSIYHLSKTKEIFDSKIEISNPQIECDKNKSFQTEIDEFNKEFYIRTREIKTRRICNEILSCITGYLIKQSYIKAKKNQTINFLTDFNQRKTQNLEINFEEKEFIELRFLGQGFSSAVELIYHIEREELFAIKKPKHLELIEREYNNYLQIDFPLLSKFYGKISNKNDLIIQFICGRSLSNIQDFHFSDSDKAIILFEIMYIINYFHKNDFVYRDLKPDNIIVDENKLSFIIDFDRMIKYSNKTDGQNHTVDFQTVYMAPEVILGSITFENDIYSIGQMIYFIMNEKQPERQENETIKQIKNERIKSLYQRCINNNYEERPDISKLMFEFYLMYQKEIDNSFLKDISELKYFRGIINCDKKLFLDDINKAIEFLEIASKYDNILTQTYLGALYIDNHYIKQDLNKAIHYMTLAADSNYDVAQFLLGEIYINGKYMIPDANKAIHYFTLAAEQQNVDAQYKLGLIYYDGQYVKRDINKSIYYFNLAVNQNHVMSQFKLGWIYYEDKFIERNIYKSIHYFSLAGVQGDVEALFLLGTIYFDGKYIEKDIGKVLLYFSLAAERSHLNSIYNLGLIYIGGEYVKRDFPKGIKYLTFAADHDHPKAQFYMGLIYSDGKYIPRDINKAIKYFTLAAKHNDVDAQNRLAVIYFSGKFIDRNIEKAIYYFKQAADLNDKDAQYNLGLFYFDNIHAHRDMKKSIHYFSLAAENGCVKSQLNLGILYSDGKYINRDINKSILYFTMAANQNDPLAQYNLGVIYFSDDFIKKDVKKSIYYYTLAADQNYLDAQFNLGLIYYNGKNTAKDIKKAFHYFLLASKQNDKQSQFFVGLIYYEGGKIERDIKKSIHYFLLSADQGYSQSLFNLGIIYYEGKYVDRDINKSIHYFTLAANQNYSDAQYNLGIIYLNYKKDISKALHYLLLAIKQGNSFAQFTFGNLYLSGTFIEQNINKGMNLLIQSSSNGSVQANFTVGYYYQEGKYINRDIEKSIHHYKEASSFNNQYAKNNLGIVYKYGFEDKIPQNIGLAIEYFVEAINQAKDKVAMYNLAHTFIYEIPTKARLNESIELLFKLSSRLSVLQSDLFYSSSNILLCIALIKKYGNEIDEIKKEIKDKTDQYYTLINSIVIMIDKQQVFEEKYEKHKTINFLYNSELNIISTKELKEQKQYIDESDAKNLSSEFYEGFGL